MLDSFETTEWEEAEDWVEICDEHGQKTAFRRLATITHAGRTYFVLCSIPEDEDDSSEGALLLLREEATVDGVKQYVIARDEKEIERVIGSYILEELFDCMDFSPKDDFCVCGRHHRPGEFCFCGIEEYLQ